MLLLAIEEEHYYLPASPLGGVVCRRLLRVGATGHVRRL